MSGKEKRIILNLTALLFVIGFAISISTAMKAVEQRKQVGLSTWVLLVITIFMIILASWFLSRAFFVQRRVGEKLFDLWVYNIKTFRVLLIFYAAINLFQIVTMILEPGYNGVLLELTMFSIILIIIPLFILGNGVYDKGIILAGYLYMWYKIKAFEIDGENLEIKVNHKIQPDAKPSIVKVKLKFKKQDSDLIKAYLDKRLSSER